MAGASGLGVQRMGCSRRSRQRPGMWGAEFSPGVMGRWRGAPAHSITVILRLMPIQSSLSREIRT